jgi:hypothetical protein
MKSKDIRIGKRLFTIISNEVKIIDVLSVDRTKYHRVIIEYIDILNGNIECVQLNIRPWDISDYWFTPQALRNKI